MRTKLMLEALAAWLALAAASGQACASIQTGASSALGATTVLTMAANPMVAGPEASLDHEVTTPYSGRKISANRSTRVNADIALLTSAATAGKGTSTGPTSGVPVLARGPLRVDARHSNAAPGFSLMESRQRAVFNRHEMVD